MMLTAGIPIPIHVSATTTTATCTHVGGDVLTIADALNRTGLQKAGYCFLNSDAGWQPNKDGRNASGSPVSQRTTCIHCAVHRRAVYTLCCASTCCVALCRAVCDTHSLIPPHTQVPAETSTADALHARGFKMGLYSALSSVQCGGAPGGLYHEDLDAAAYQSWGLDYLKYVCCITLHCGLHTKKRARHALHR